jgi:hypothetical protein
LKVHADLILHVTFALTSPKDLSVSCGQLALRIKGGCLRVIAVFYKGGEFFGELWPVERKELRWESCVRWIYFTMYFEILTAYSGANQNVRFLWLSLRIQDF